jgi:predicted DNA-binding protein
MSESAKRVSAPIRMSPDMLEHVNTAAQRTGLSQAEILRLALSLGLEDLRCIDYDLTSVIAAAARQRSSSGSSATKPDSHASQVIYPDLATGTHSAK